MIDHVERRFLAFFLALMMVVCILPLQVLAEQTFTKTVLEGKVRVRGDGDTTVASGSEVDGTVTAYVNATGECSGFSTTYTANAHTIYVENATPDETLALTFDYKAELNDGSLTVDEKIVTASGTIKRTLAPGEMVTFVLTSPESDESATLVLSDFELADANARTVVVKPGSNGTVSVDGTAITADKTVETTYTTGVAVKAVPNSGYEFVAWVDADNNVKATAATATINPENDMTVSAVFVPVNGTAHWLAGDKLHTDLGAACTAAQSGNKLVVLLNNGTLSGEYTIPDDVTVLIPYDDYHSLSGSDPVTESIPSSTSNPTAKLYRKLTMAENAKITVDGALELGAKHYASHGGKYIGGTPVTGYGQIEMGKNSQILVNGTLYAWGYVTGSGEVIVESGASVYEKFQVTDYHGGTNTTAVVSKNIFPFNQYYIQNVEVRETLKAGATLYVHAGIYAEEVQENEMSFLGTGDGMFQLSSGSITKSYDPTTDRLQLDINGTVSMDSITLKLGSQSQNTAKFVLPLNNNLTININEGASATVNQDLVLLPGAQINLDEGASLTVASGKSVYVMDSENWGEFCFGANMRQLKYVASRNGAPVTRTLSDAKVSIDGDVTLKGKLYNSEAGAWIGSEGKTGTVFFEGAVDNKTTTIKFSSAIKGLDAGATDVTMNPVQLRNGDNTTMDTMGIVAGTEVRYFADCDQWMETFTLSFDANGGEGEMESMKVHGGEECRFPLPEVGFTAPKGKVFAGWNTVATPTEENPGTAYGDKYELYDFKGDITLYAQWKDEVTGLKGDVDLDGDVDFEDAVMLTRHYMDVEIIENEMALANADVDGDGEITLNDAVKLTRFALDVDSEL